jgi:capsular polysaccharide biosynthesis protein
MEHQSAGIAKSFPEWRVFESIAELHGYEVIYPEQHQLHDQISMFAAARVIVGEFGSALHNSVFCGPGTVIGATGFFGEAQLKLCSLSDQIGAYVPHESQEYINGVLHYSCSTISIAEFFRSIDEHLKEEIK